MRKIDSFLNGITMYRLLVYGLSILAGLGFVFAGLGYVAARPPELLLSLIVLLGAAYVTDRGLARFFGVPGNRESWLITALILFLILSPGRSAATLLALALAGGVASASKFLVAWHGKHLFNPAALAATFMTYWGLLPATWWVGNSHFWPFSLVIGLAVARKTRRLFLPLTFAVVSLALQLLLLLHAHQPVLLSLKQAALASPLIFLSTIMLTEPATMPPRRNAQLLFAALVAVLYTEAWRLGPLVFYPETALLAGNLFAYLVAPKSRVRLELQEVQKVSDRVYNYIFRPDRRFGFLPGQYMEWTLDSVPYDSRGNRRTFTIASSPTEPTVQLGLKYYEPASMYKATFEQLKPGAVIYGSQLAGNFTLRDPEKQKLAFIAGGIGITPFRSMVKYLTDTNQTTDGVLLYSVSDPHEFAYTEVFAEARRIGLKTIPIVTDPASRAPGVVAAKLNSELLARLVPDYPERLFYVSGPNAMVGAVRHDLARLGVPKRRIKTDHFSGY